VALILFYVSCYAKLATLASLTADTVGYASSVIENSGSASFPTYLIGTAEATDLGADGKICVIDSGVIFFHGKVFNCEDSGGLGAIIINNEPGMLFRTLVETNATRIPAVGATQVDRAS